jgi:hypothetical protein
MILVVMDKFCKGKMFNPCFRVSSAIDLKISFQFLNEILSISVSLRVMSSRGCNSVVKEFSKGMREL